MPTASVASDRIKGVVDVNMFATSLLSSSSFAFATPAATLASLKNLQNIQRTILQGDSKVSILPIREQNSDQRKLFLSMVCEVDILSADNAIHCVSPAALLHVVHEVVNAVAINNDGNLLNDDITVTNFDVTEVIKTLKSVFETSVEYYVKGYDIKRINVVLYIFLLYLFFSL